MRWFLMLSFAIVALTCSIVLVSSTVSSHQCIKMAKKAYKLCNWKLVINCNADSLIDIQDVTIKKFTCQHPSCTCLETIPESNTINLGKKGKINQTIYACQHQTTCNTTLPKPKMVPGDVTYVTVDYSCRGVPTTSTSESTETSSSVQGTTHPSNEAPTPATVSINSSSSSSAIASTIQINTVSGEGHPESSTSTSGTSIETDTRTSIGVTDSAEGHPESSTSTSGMSVKTDAGTSNGVTADSGQSVSTSGQTTGSATVTTPSDPIVNKKDSRKQRTLRTAVTAIVPTILVVAGIIITVIICIRRKRRGQYPDDKTAVLSASRNDSTTDSSDDDTAESHPDSAGTSHNKNTVDQNGGYIAGDYIEIEINGDTNDSSEYNTIDLKTFKVVAADPTYNHIGISSSLGANAASPNGGLTMTQDTDSSYATCGETETVVADEGGIRGKASVQDVDNYSHVSHVAKSAEGSESQWQMLVGDDNAGSSSEGAQVLQAVSEVGRDDNPGVGKTSDSEIDSHSYFILERQFS